ncbi:hypothetical protein LWC08_12630 [Desulfobaculum bizertense]|uniref:hypothetical protein n=1 Tax=Desulfobaculum bizertense TaxID=376490 RepID=UPI001F2097E4|nr:hypothetical protein [Desulfobaculum bizertense]UIJ37543.1 hypothetical protein LWC08_12630 [Desulfobaculum bizertense]
MNTPSAHIRVGIYPLDPRLAFFRLEVTDSQRVDLLALFAEQVEQAASAYTSQTKVTLTSDGGTFIIAFLNDKAPVTKEELQRHMDTLADEHNSSASR